MKLYNESCSIFNNTRRKITSTTGYIDIFQVGLPDRFMEKLNPREPVTVVGQKWWIKSVDVGCGTICLETCGVTKYRGDWILIVLGNRLRSSTFIKVFRCDFRIISIGANDDFNVIKLELQSTMKPVVTSRSVEYKFLQEKSKKKKTNESYEYESTIP